MKEENSFCLIIANIQRVLKLWKLRKLTLEGKILTFKTLALLKIIFQAFVKPKPNYVVTELQKRFLWANSTLEIKHDTHCNDYKDGTLKNYNSCKFVYMDKKTI